MAENENLFDHYEDVNKHNLYLDLKRVRNRLLTIGLIFFLMDLLSMLVTDNFTLPLFLFSLVIPAIMGILAMLAFREPMAAMIIAAIVIAGVWVYLVVILGPRGVISGLIMKVVVIYLLISGFQSAHSAQRLKRELGNAG